MALKYVFDFFGFCIFQKTEIFFFHKRILEGLKLDYDKDHVFLFANIFQLHTLVFGYR
jgi:hypothetical protein